MKDKISGALRDRVLQEALDRFAPSYLEARTKAYAGWDFQDLRHEIARTKDQVVENLSALADRFEAEATRRGAVVFRAKNAAEARNYILELAQRKGARRFVKSKSMASEEIDLNQFLEEKGLHVVETDLGEWIIQQLGQRPSHMVMPAIHLTRKEVADLFSQRLGETVPPDITHLVKLARQILREEFLAADIGISGANLAVAETGTVIILTNEGNGRLTTTLPPVHVVLVGYEKLVPTLREVLPILRALPRSATAQEITSYVTMITGPVEAWAKEARQVPAGNQGQTSGEPATQRKELYIILLDNGRQKMAADPLFKEALRCIRCASCLNVCPTYLVTGGHVFGHIYAGAIGTILNAFLLAPELAEQFQELCIGCGRCRDYCPAEIDLPRLLLELRQRKVAQKGLPFAQRAILRGVLRNRRVFHSILRAVAQGQKPFTKGSGFIRHLPLYFADLTAGRSLPAIAEVPFRDRVLQLSQKVWPEEEPGLSPSVSTDTSPEGEPTAPGTVSTKKSSEDEPAASRTVSNKTSPASITSPTTELRSHDPVSFFAGCLIDFAYPEQGEAVYKVLNSLGLKVQFPQEQNCCGAPALYLGDRETAQELARQNIKAFAAGSGPIISACPTCTSTLRQYPELLQDDPQWSAQAQAFAARVKDFSSYVAARRAAVPGRAMDDARKGRREVEEKREPLKITYHDSCHLKRHLGVFTEPRLLLQETGAELVEMTDADVCCGFGGTYSLKFPELSQALLEKKLNNIEATAAEVVVTDCPGCVLQIRGGLDKRGRPIQVKHTAEILAAEVEKGPLDEPPVRGGRAAGADEGEVG